MRREKGKFFVTIVQGNPVQKSDEGWKKRQEKVQQFSFANRTDAMLRSGATRKES
jgi:hypothetical protein